MNAHGPIGYPPPTLVRKRTGLTRLAIVAILAVAAVAVLLGGYALSRAMWPAPAPAPNAPVAVRAPVVGIGTADMPPAALPDAGRKPPVTIEAPGADDAITDPPVDARRANRWYYVGRLGDGPAAIYSRTGGQWTYALACTPRTRMIEFIAVGTGSPGDFDQQSIDVGKVHLPMDASYSKDGGGTISMTLPASHGFFEALDGSAPMEIQLVATRKTIVPVGPAVVRLIQECRGRG